MYKLLFLVLLVTSTSIFAQTPRKIANWVAVSGWSHPTTKAYVDKNSLRHDETTNYSYGIILLVNSELTEVNISDGNKIIAKSVARYFVTDCDTALIAPLAEFYFNTPGLPSLNDKPISAMDYTNATGNVNTISKKSPIYLALCPKYI